MKNNIIGVSFISHPDLACENVIKPTTPHSDIKTPCKVYKRRWFMLALFVATSSVNAIHWLQYSIIANITIKYYQVTPMAVNWSSMVYMVVYVPLVFPATWVLEKKGLRFCMILGAAVMTSGAWLKLLTLGRDMFYVGFLAQGIIGAAQIFLLSVPARLAGIWFDANQVSTACALGVFGNQLGIALGFVLPPEIVKDSSNLDDIAVGLRNLYIGFAIPSTILLILIFFFFESEPPSPPSIAESNKRNKKNEKSNNSFLEIMKNKDYMILLLSYGINVGVFYAYSTLLNQLFLIHYPAGEAEAGYVGLTLIIGGMIGSVIWGIFLDKTHMFKATTIIVYCCALIGMSGFTFSLYYEFYVFIYITSGFLGFFMNGFLTVAFEFTSELTYPVPESTSTGVLNAVGELVGLALVLISGIILENYDDLYTNVSLTTILLLGLVASIFIAGNKLQRQAAETKG